jgi:predicted outer membrane repeat protein
MNPRITPTIKSAAIAVLLICTVAILVHAATITVTNTNDSGAGSLRQALAIANDGDTITFAVTGTIGLTSGELLVDKSITISGPGAASLAINGNAKSRVFHIGASRTVTISGLTITNGNASGEVPDGGGIYNDHAALTLGDCTISDNSAFRDGGGILNDGQFGGAMLTLSNCTISGNLTGNYGGGICNHDGGGSATLEISDSVLSSNSAEFGGGISNDGRMGGTAMLQISNSTLSSNSGGYDAGAILTIGDSGHATATLTNCTISGNSAQVHGGGIYCVVTDVPLRQKGRSDCKALPVTQHVTGTSALTIVNSTVSGNIAGTIGGGIYNHALIGIASSTFSGNSAGSGGGIYNDGGVPPLAVEISNAILNAGALGENIFNNGGTVTSLGYNISSDDGSGFLTGPGDQINTDPLLDPLQDNGGPTFTHELLSGSPAIDAGDPGFTPPPFFDQRGPGFDRVVNGRIDIGSFEVQGPTPTPTPTPGAITLSAHGRRVQGRHTVDLSWIGATSANIDIYRDGVVIATAPNNGTYKDFIGVRGGNARYIYKVCDADTQNCSNQVTVRFGGPPL